MRRLPAMLVVSLLASLVVATAPEAAVGGSLAGRGSTIAGDFDGDGFEDLAIGVPREAIQGVDGAGAVHVLYGSGRGPKAAGGDFWHEDRRGIRGVAEEFDRFGSALAAGDFDGDGRDDLAIGVSGQDLAGLSAGAVHVLYGSHRGLSRRGDEVWHRDQPGVRGPVGSDGLGAALAAGDFDRSGRADLAIGAPFGDVGGVSGAGYVQVLYGSRGGVTARGDDVFHQDTLGIADDPGPVFEGFGSALAAANFGWSRAPDLAIGVPGEDIDGNPESGAAHVLRGTRQGLTAAGSQFWHQNVPDVEGEADSGTEGFGSSLAAGDFGRSRHADLAVGVPSEDFVGTSNAGALNVLYGSAGGLTASGDQLWWQGAPGVLGEPETDDGLGSGVAAGNFGRSRQADLASGAFNADVNGMFSAGEVNALYGSPGGLTADRDQLWTQDSAGVNDAADDPTGTGGFGDEFGFVLSAGQYGKGGGADLAVAALGEDVGGAVDAGAVHVLFSQRQGIRARGDQFWHQDRQGMPDRAEEDEQLGEALG